MRLDGLPTDEQRFLEEEASFALFRRAAFLVRERLVEVRAEGFQRFIAFLDESRLPGSIPGGSGSGRKGGKRQQRAEKGTRGPRQQYVSHALTPYPLMMVRGLLPLAGPTIPSDSNWSMSLVARLYPICRRRWSRDVDMDERPDCNRNSRASS